MDQPGWGIVYSLFEQSSKTLKYKHTYSNIGSDRERRREDSLVVRTARVSPCVKGNIQFVLFSICDI